MDKVSANTNQKTFIIATLCSTLIGTFTSSIGLWDRVQDKRKQHRVDTRQSNDIKELKELVKKNEERIREREFQTGSPHPPHPQFMIPDHYGYSNGMMQALGIDQGMRGGGSRMEMVDPAYNFRMSGDMIQRQYDEGYQRLGSRFAVGDSESAFVLPLTYSDILC